MGLEGKWAKSEALGDTESFALSLDLEDKYSNISRTQRVFIKIYEGEVPNERWVTIEWIEINLPACQGLEAPPEALAAGGEFKLVEGECVWDGAYTYDSITGEWTEPVDTGAGQDETESLDTTLLAGIGGIILMILVITVFFMRRGGEDVIDKVDMFGAQDVAYGGDPVEQYVQQLVAQGYPEETARQFAQQYMGGAAEAQPQQAVQQAAPVQAAGGAYEQYYQQYYQQFISQGYDEATASAYAQQYATQYAQQMGQM